MSVLHPKPGPHRIHTVHRVAAAVLGTFLVVFGVLGLLAGPTLLSTEGAFVMGLTTNGLLSLISLIVGAVLLVAAVRGGPAASTILIVTGAGFLVSGLVNMFVLGTSMNMLAFSLANVVFSLVVGCFLLILGAYGRISGRLPEDNPYSSQPEAPTATAITGGGESTAPAPTVPERRRPTE